MHSNVSSLIIIECAVEEVKMSQEIPVDSQTVVKENEKGFEQPPPQ